MARHAVFLLFLCAMAGCSPGPANPIVGKWEEIEPHKGYRTEFFKDGSAVFERDSFTFHGKWRFSDDGRLITEILVGGREPIHAVRQQTVEFDGDIMTLTEEVDNHKNTDKHKRVATFSSRETKTTIREP